MDIIALLVEPYIQKEGHSIYRDYRDHGRYKTYESFEIFLRERLVKKVYYYLLTSLVGFNPTIGLYDTGVDLLPEDLQI